MPVLKFYKQVLDPGSVKKFNILLVIPEPGEINFAEHEPEKIFKIQWCAGRRGIVTRFILTM